MRGQRSALGEDRQPNNMMLLALGFVVFWIGGVVFGKAETDRLPRGVGPAVALGVHALSVVGMALMLAGGCLMLAAVVV